MRTDSRLARLLHVLLHMVETDEPLTSNDIGEMLGANPAFVRRLMAALKAGGYVRSERGHGGGWTLARALSEITLLDVYTALGRPELFAFGLANPEPACLVEQEVNATMRGAIGEAEDALLRRFGEIRLSEIEDGYKARLAGSKAGKPREDV